jgi:predicted nucleic acid-binding protein
MSFLLDTNVVSELRKRERANAALREWFDDVADGEIHLSVLVVGELRRGVETLRKRDPAQAAALDRWMGRLVAHHADRILAVDAPVAERWGRLSAIRSASVIDTMMAATALEHGLVLVTRNVKDIAWTGVSFLDPFVRAS